MWIPDGRIKFDDGSGKSSSPAFGTVILELCGKRKRIKHWSIDA